MKNGEGRWKGPTIREIAKSAGVGTATVDRVLNNRQSVREKSRRRVEEALHKLTSDQGRERSLEVRLFCESGESFNAAMADAVEYVNRSVPGTTVRATFVTTDQLDPGGFATALLNEGVSAQGVVVVANEHPAFNSAIRRLESCDIPVVCLTSDLPSSRRSAYVGNDQYAAGSVAGLLIGPAIASAQNRVLLATSSPFRCQQEREMGFRRVLRSDFPHLKVDDRVISDDRPDTVYDNIMHYIEGKGPPAAVYNVAGANRGVAKALEKAGCSRETVFVGHELTPSSKRLLEDGVMDYVISHDFCAELAASVTWISDRLNGIETRPWTSPVLVHTRYNCEL